MAKETEEVLTEAEKKELLEGSNKIEEKKKKEAEGKFSKEEVAKMIKDAIAEDKKGAEMKADSLDEEDPYAQKKLTIPRFVSKDGTTKFVVGFKNVNQDEYFKEKTVQAFDVWNDLQKRNEAYVTAIYEDGSEMTVPLFTIIKKSVKVLVDIVDIPKVNKSYSLGKTQATEVKGYSKVPTGEVNMKVTQYDYSYIVRLPDGKEMPVGKEVVNWQIIPENK